MRKWFIGIMILIMSFISIYPVIGHATNEEGIISVDTYSTGELQRLIHMGYKE